MMDDKLVQSYLGAPDVLSILPPPFEWCPIPAGQVTLERRAGTFEVKPFLIAKYPVTFEQFQVFVDDPHGFKNVQWHDLDVAIDHWEAPGTQCFTHAKNLPRDSVSRFDAEAFCRWLSSREGRGIRLPTECEWQWAAQGPDGREYPWGNEYLQGYANINELFGKKSVGAHLKRTTPVGSYPQGASPYGVLDMCGNVWEWCSNKFGNPDNPYQGRHNGSMLRGGS